MKLWLSKNSEVPVRVQLAEQIVLGIASGDLQPDEKLPSTRELARRFGIHQNTVSAVYRSLAEQGHLVNRKGSGVYVRPNGHDPSARPRLDELFNEFRRRAEAAGYTAPEIEDHLTQYLRSGPPDRILVVESDPALREIIIEEVREASNLPVSGISLEAFANDPPEGGYIVAAMFDEKPKLGPLLKDGCSAVYLAANSVPDSLSGGDRPADDELIAVVSGWDRFLSLAHLFLVAARIDPGSIVSRSTTEPDWRRSTDAAALVVCDSLTARKFPEGDRRVRVFRLVSSASLRALTPAAK
jgi:GntR family transcriptional regulator